MFTDKHFKVLFFVGCVCVCVCDHFTCYKCMRIYCLYSCNIMCNTLRLWLFFPFFFFFFFFVFLFCFFFFFLSSDQDYSCCVFVFYTLSMRNVLQGRCVQCEKFLTSQRKDVDVFKLRHSEIRQGTAHFLLKFQSDTLALVQLHLPLVVLICQM